MSRTRKKHRGTTRPADPAPVPARQGAGGGVSKFAWAVLGASLALTVAVLVVRQWWQAEPPAPASPSVAASARPAEFLGSDACESCHAAEHRAWRGSQHRAAMQQATAASVLGDFNDAAFRYAGTESRFFRRGDAFFVHTDGPDGKPADFNVGYTYGVYPLQQYLVVFPDGRLQALSIAWDARPQEHGGQRWFHLYPKEKVDYRDELHWTKRAQNWNFMCADCHSTNVRKNYDAARDEFRTQWSELSVGCEACHGPGSRHVEWAARKGSDPARGLTVGLDERRGVTWPIDPASGTGRRSAPRSADREIEVCAQCHARRAQIAEGYHAGRPFLDHYRPALLEPGLYFADGQQRDEVYVWGSFLQSRMYHAGVTCSDCHEPHGGKLRAEGNAVCAQCHLPEKFDAPSHHFHKAGAGCVDCHMPPTTYMVVDPRRDHSLRVPRPDLTVAHGVPNACNACHPGKAAQWAADAVRKWYGRDAQGFQRYAGALAAAESGAPGAAGLLAVLADDRTQPAIARASALAAIDRYPSQSGIAAIRRGLADGNALVRGAAAAALAPVPAGDRVPLLAPLLDDPLRAIRIEAAFSLAAAPESTFTPAQRASFERAATEFEQAQRHNSDRPEARVALADFYARRSRLAEAEAEYRAALVMQPPYVPAYVNFADMYREQGRDAAGEAVLAEGLKLAPESAALHHARGLALVRLKRPADALASLARAARLAPDDARFAYVHAVALNSAGEARAAIAEIDRALTRHPWNRALLNAGVAFARDSGDAATAARHAKTLSDLEAAH